MKKVIFAFAFVLSFGAVHAQREVVFGIKGGVQFTNFTGDVVDSNTNTGFYIGGLVDFHITPKFHVQPELLYSAEGSDEGGVSYIRIPVMAKIYLSPAFTFQAGPQIAFKAGAEDDFTDAAIKSTDFGLGIGLGYEMPAGFMVDARYNFGLSNISEVDGADIKNSGFMVGIGYRF